MCVRVAGSRTYQPACTRQRVLTIHLTSQHSAPQALVRPCCSTPASCGINVCGIERWHPKVAKLHFTLLQYSWELWHRQGDYPHGAAAFAFAAAAAAAGFRAQRPESSPGGKPGPGGHTTARMRAGIGYSHVEQVRQLLMACHCNVFLCTCMHAWLARTRPVRPYAGVRRRDPCPPPVAALL